MGGAPLRARAWYARKMKPKLSIRNRRGVVTLFRVTLRERETACRDFAAGVSNH